jgi:ADP-ribose pyrophosphatase YjhB (NUDIX family)
LPGGGVERNETAAAALRRKLCEQAGIVLTGAPRLAGIHLERSPGDHVVVMAVREWMQPPVPPAGFGGALAHFFVADALPAAASAECRRRIAGAVAGSTNEPLR